MELHKIVTADDEVFQLNTPGARVMLSATPPSWGMPPIQYNRRRFYYQDGETELNFRLQPRRFQLRLTAEGCNRNDLFTLRQQLLNLMRPNRGGLLQYIFFTEDEQTQYAIDGYSLVAGEGVPDDIWDDNAYTETLLFDCANPVWYDPATQTCQASEVIAGELVFPITFDDDGIIFGSDDRWGQCEIDYSAGTWYAYPVITATGPWTRLTINHEELGVSIYYSNAAVAGEVITFDLRIRYDTNNNPIGPTVVDALGDDQFDNLDTLTDLARFRIEPASVLVSGGINTITFDAVDFTDATDFTVEYRLNYIGI